MNSLGGYFEFFADADQTIIKNWSGNEMIKDQFGIMPGGSPVGFWKNDEGEQCIVLLDNEGEEDGCIILAKSFIDFARLIAIGYHDFKFNEFDKTIEEWNKEKEDWSSEPWDDDDDDAYDEIEEFGYQKLYGVNIEFQNWLTKSFQVFVPLRGNEIVNKLNDSFGKWMISKISY